MLHITNIKPMGSSVLTTGDLFETDVKDGGIIVFKEGTLKPWQTVIAIGPFVRDVKVGDKIMINPENYAKKRYDKNSIQNDMDNNPTLTYEFPWEVVENGDGTCKNCLLLTDRDVKYVFEGYEKEEPQEHPTKLILPGKPKIIV